jgi:hypothetical protein
MTAADKKLQLGVRKIMMAAITAHPDHYKVCESCRWIWKSSTRICGACGAYRWEYDCHTVIAMAAAILPQRISQIPGVVPRLTI